MKKAKKKHDAFAEHYLVPSALSLLNIALVHVVYAYSNSGADRLGHLIAPAFGLVLLGCAVLFKNRTYLWCAMTYYLAALTYSCWP